MEDYLKVAERLISKYKTHETHVKHVAALADWLFVELADVHRLPQEAKLELLIAAYLHDIGHIVGEKHHHRHSCYLLLSDELLQGWSPELRGRVAYAALNHRKKKPQSWNWSLYGDWVPSGEEEQAKRLDAVAGLLRIADVLDYEHNQKTVLTSCRYLPQEQLVLLELEGMELSRYERKLNKKLRWAASCWETDFVLSNAEDRIVILRQ